MNKQVIKEMIQLLGVQKVIFDTPVTVKTSPHNPPEFINEAWYSNGDVFLKINDDEVTWEMASVIVKNSVAQRLRLVLYERQKALEGIQ